jgi:hypothetical protein
MRIAKPAPLKTVQEKYLRQIRTHPNRENLSVWKRHVSPFSGTILQILYGKRRDVLDIPCALRLKAVSLRK